MRLDLGACSAFLGSRRIAAGALVDVAVAAKEATDGDKWAQVVVFNDVTSEVVELDLRGTVEQVRERYALAPQPASPRTAGRPKLGVVAREVTLLPRHWEWLAEQPGGASVALRKLVEHARSANRGADETRRTREAAYRFLSVMAGNEAGFEAATRALFAGRRAEFEKAVENWPADVRGHATMLAARSFGEEERRGIESGTKSSD